MILGCDYMDLLILVLFTIIVLICIVIAFYTFIYNKFQDTIIRINEVEATIDSNLRQKYDLINRSISIIKANVEIRSKVFDDVARLRSRKISNFDLDRKLVCACNEIISVKDEHKEEIKSDELKKIIKQLKEIDDKLETFRDYYNSNIVKYNKMVKTFPTNIVALLCKYEDKLFFDMKNMTDDDVEDFKL